ncbi:lytic transglycosylase domain-containing protein [Acidihalobacter prosperus]|uniref:Transglycosylase SLT domain-containing protein n=1 Tax=Acidihalobacter prosperus TaxID=160660 RepID=A0A1A6C317_9GAMM|nr:lytic transglycosylase domain-containing protein [Acidihalobacter prosperus]OBS08962.1 hypothetical protein Thpro_022079 [Acidihalobacter prosperus]
MPESGHDPGVNLRFVSAMIVAVGLMAAVGLPTPAWSAPAPAPRWPTPQCVLTVARADKINPWALLGIMQTEGGRPGQAVKDGNGTYDLGPMQVNTLWMPKLARIGITRAEVQNDGCINLAVAAAILKNYLSQAHGNLARAIGWYHSHTRRLAAGYRLKVAASIRDLAGLHSPR